MKFQNPSIHPSKVNGRTHTQTDRQAKSNMPFQLFQSWGHKYDVMHQSFISTAPPPTGKGRDYDFSVFSALL